MRILLAEDDSNISMIAKITLEKLGNHQVIVAVNGKQALELALKENFDLILLDGMMPQLDGVSVLRQLTSGNSSIPVIFLSAKSQESDIKEIMELGAIGYIQKPFDPKTLCLLIDDMMRKAS